MPLSLLGPSIPAPSSAQGLPLSSSVAVRILGYWDDMHNPRPLLQPEASPQRLTDNNNSLPNKVVTQLHEFDPYTRCILPVPSTCVSSPPPPADCPRSFSCCPLASSCNYVRRLIISGSPTSSLPQYWYTAQADHPSISVCASSTEIVGTVLGPREDQAVSVPISKFN